MKLSVLIQVAASITSAAAASSFYPFTGDLYSYGDLQVRKISKTEPYRLGGTEGKVVYLTLGDDGTLQDSDGDYVYCDLSSTTQYYYPSLNGTVLKDWSIQSNQLNYKDGNTFTACPLNDKSATWASGLSDCNKPDDISIPKRLVIDTDVSKEGYENAPRFNLHVANSSTYGDGFLKIGSLAPYGYSIGEGDEIATFTLLPNHKVFDQNDFVALNDYSGYAKPLGEVVRNHESQVYSKDNFVLTKDKKYIYLSTSPDDPQDSDFIISTSWYVCKNGSIPFISSSSDCNIDTNTALDPPPHVMLELNYKGGDTSSSTSSSSSTHSSTATGSTIIPSSGTTSTDSSTATESTSSPSSGTTSTETGSSKPKTSDATTGKTDEITTPTTSITGATAKPTTPTTSITGATAKPSTASPSTTGSGSGASSSAYASAYAQAVALGKSGASASAYAYAYAAAVSCGNGSASAYAYAEAFASSFTSGDSYAYAEAYAYAFALCGYVKPPTYATVTVSGGSEATVTGEICYCKGDVTTTTYCPLPTTTVYTECAGESTTVVTTSCWPVVEGSSTYFPSIAETATVTISPVTSATAEVKASAPAVASASATAEASASVGAISTYENNAAGRIASVGALMAGVALAIM